MKKVNVTIDPQEIENNYELMPLIDQHEEIEGYTIDDLKLGDLVVDDTGVVIERKTMEDFISSINDGRLREQPQRLSENADYPFILIEGDMDDFGYKKYRVNIESVRGMIASISIRQGVPVMCVSSTEGLVDMTARLGRKAIEDPSQGFVNTGATKNSAPVQVRMYSCFPGVGITRAWDLYEEFPTIPVLMHAGISELSEVDGIGPKTAEKIKEVLQ